MTKSKVHSYLDLRGRLAIVIAERKWDEVKVLIDKIQKAESHKLVQDYLVEAEKRFKTLNNGRKFV